MNGGYLEGSEIVVKDQFKQLFAMQAKANDLFWAKNEVPAQGAAGFMTMQRLNDAVRDLDANLGPNGETNRWLQNFTRALTDETRELQDELLWKWWSKDKLDLQNIRVEIIDLLHFWISLAQAAGLSAEEAFKIYEQKHTINVNRAASGYSKATKDESDNKSIVT